MRVRINYPVISFSQMDVEMSEDEYEDLKNKPLKKQAQYIVSLHEERGEFHIADWQQIESALDVDYAFIKKAP